MPVTAMISYLAQGYLRKCLQFWQHVVSEDRRRESPWVLDTPTAVEFILCCWPSYFEQQKIWMTSHVERSLILDSILNCKKKLWVVDTQSIFLFIVSLNNSTISPPLPFSLLPPKIRKMRINPRKCIPKMAPLWHLQVPTLCSSQADGNGICYIDEKKCMLREHGFYKSVKTLNLHLGLPAFFLLICVLLSQNFQCVLCLTREDQFNLDSLLDFIMLPEYILVFPYWLRQAKVNLFFWKCVHVLSDFWIPQIRNCLHFHKDLASLLIKPETFLFLYWCWVKKVEFASA